VTVTVNSLSTRQRRHLSPSDASGGFASDCRFPFAVSYGYEDPHRGRLIYAVFVGSQRAMGWLQGGTDSPLGRASFRHQFSPPEGSSSQSIFRVDGHSALQWLAAALGGAGKPRLARPSLIACHAGCLKLHFDVAGGAHCGTVAPCRSRTARSAR
jgi:hypothetical protein